MSSWKKAGIEPILEFGEVNKIKINPDSIINKVKFKETMENFEINKDLNQNEPLKFGRTHSINNGWGLVNKNQMEYIKTKHISTLQFYN